MSLAGLKKQLNKANQFVSEKIGGVKGTELDDNFNNLENKTDALGKLVEEVTARTNELLQPNPAVRMKLLAQKSVSKIRGQTNSSTYPQPEGQLSECFIRCGSDLGSDSLLGKCLTEAGESYKQLADIKYNLEDSVHQNFLEPLQHLQNKELKEVNFHRKKLHGRRLDYDCKKRNNRGQADDDLKAAEEKFLESKDLAETAMNNLLDNEVEQLTQLSSFIEAELNFHTSSAQVLQQLHQMLTEKCKEAGSRPRKHHVIKKVPLTPSPSSTPNPSSPTSATHPPSLSGPVPTPRANESVTTKTTVTNDNLSAKEPYCEALYDFESENPGELGFKEGEKIKLLSHIDENWLEGCLNGKTGYFPITYVNIVIDTDKRYQG